MLKRLVVGLAVLLLAGPVRAQIGTPGVTTPEVLPGPANPILFDDFLCGTTASNGSIGCLGWTSVISTGTGMGLADRPGVIRFSATGSTWNYLTMPSTLYFVTLLENFRRVVGAASWSTGANQPDSRFGMTGSSPSGAPTNGGAAYFERLSGDSYWYACVRDNGGTDRYVTDAAFSANTFYTLEVSHPRADLYEFYVDNRLVKSVTGATHMPPETDFVNPFFQIKSNGTDSTFDVDWLLLELRTSRTWTRN